ncbi:hypothetical protein LX36DRAFT_667209 [Colletotrichum falcatum]|nr:hypothetical protein LX36DRAFT_667209 [Colletotrichum falcatum]
MLQRLHLHCNARGQIPTGYTRWTDRSSPLQWPILDPESTDDYAGGTLFPDLATSSWWSESWRTGAVSATIIPDGTDTSISPFGSDATRNPPVSMGGPLSALSNTLPHRARRNARLVTTVLEWTLASSTFGDLSPCCYVVIPGRPAHSSRSLDPIRSSVVFTGPVAEEGVGKNDVGRPGAPYDTAAMCAEQSPLIVRSAAGRRLNHLEASSRDRLPTTVDNRLLSLTFALVDPGETDEPKEL